MMSAVVDVHSRSLIPRRSYPAHGDSMKPFARLVPVVASLVLLMNITPSWGQPVCVAPGCNPTTSDGLGSTAGGSGALSTLVSQGFDLSNGGGHTAFGYDALRRPASGTFWNTAVGMWALGGLV